jgi:hypothetical protein
MFEDDIYTLSPKYDLITGTTVNIFMVENVLVDSDIGHGNRAPRNVCSAEGVVDKVYQEDKRLYRVLNRRERHIDDYSRHEVLDS